MVSDFQIFRNNQGVPAGTFFCHFSFPDPSDVRRLLHDRGDRERVPEGVDAGKTGEHRFHGICGKIMGLMSF